MSRRISIALRRTCRFLLPVLCALPPVALSGADFTWDGGHPGAGPGGNRLSHNFNWAGNVAPSNDGTANLIFSVSGAQKLQPDASQPWDINSIRFNDWAAAFTLTGNSFTIQAAGVTHAISNNSAFLQTINTNLILGADQSWRANTANLRLNGAVSLGGFQLTVTGAQQTEVTGVIDGTGSLLKSGAGRLVLSGANTYEGGTTVSGGQLQGTTTSLQGGIVNNAALIFDQAVDGAYAGSISGTGEVIRRGSGVVTFSGANSYTGDTVIEGGTLLATGGSAIGDGSRVVLSNTAGAVFDLAGSSETIGSISGGGVSGGNVTLGSGTLTVGADNTSSTYGGVISGTGSLVAVGDGALTLTGANTYTGGTTVSAGGLRGTTCSLQGNIANHASLVFDQTLDGVYAGSISGAGTVTRRGSGVVTLSGVNTHTGATIIEGGTLRVSGGSAIGDTSRVELSDAPGATFDLAGSAETIGSLAGGGSSGGNVTLGAGTLTVGADGSDSTYGGIISGAGAIEKIGAGTLTVTGANTYGGGTLVSGGELQGSTTSLKGTIANNAVVSFNQSGDGTYSGDMSGSGDLIKRGSGTVTLDGSVNLTGATGVGINRGSILLGSDNAIGSGTNLFIGDGASLRLDGNSVRVNVLSFDNGIIDFGAAGNNFFLFNDAGTHSGVLTMQNWDVDWADNLNGGIAFQSGAGNVGAGLLNSIYFSGIGSGVLGETNQTISGYGDTWNFIVANTDPFFTWDGGGTNNNWSTGANWEGGVAPPVDDSTTRVAFDGSTRTTPSLNADYTLNALRFNEGAAEFTLNASGNRVLTMDGPVPSIIQMSPNNQVINLGVVMDGTTVIDVFGGGSLTINGIVSGAGGISKVGENTLILTGNNTYQGHTTVAGGVVNIRHGNALGAVVAGTSVEGGARLELQGGISVGAEALNLDGSLRNVSGTNVYGGAIAGSGLIDVAGGTLTLAGASNNTFTGAIAVGEGTLQLDKSGGALAVSGDVTVGAGAGSSTLRLLRADQIADSSTITLHGSGAPVFDLNSQNERIGALTSGNAAAQVNLGSATLTVGDASDRTYAGTISGSGGVVKEGAGTWTLTGGSSYTGQTTVAAGAVNIRHGAALGAAGGGVNVAGGARLELQGGISVGSEPLALSGTLRNVSDSNTWSGAISGSGTLEVASGMLTLDGSSGNTFAGSTAIGDGATLQLDKSGAVQALGGQIAIGQGSGASTLRLLGANQIADTAALTLGADGTPVFDLNGFSERVGSLGSANANASVTLGGGTLTVGDGSSTTFAGVVSGTGGLTKTGSGALTLTNQNTYTGTTTVDQGTLNIGTSDALSSSSNLHLTGDSTLNLGGSSSLRINQFSFGDTTLEFGTPNANLSFLFDSAGSTDGTLRIRAWTFEGSNVIGVQDDAVDQAFLNSIFFTGIGVGIGADIAGTATTIAGYGDFFLIRPIETFVWSGGTGPGGGPSNTNWSTASNWEGGSAPGIAVRQAIVMAGSAATTNNMDNAYQTNSLLFRDSSFTINSSTNDTITVGSGGILNESTGTQTMNVGVFLGGDQIWNAEGGAMVFTNTVNLQNHNLTLDGESNITISGAIGELVNGTSGSITKTGSGMATLSGSEANTYTGPTVIEGGVLRLAKTDNVTAVAGQITVNTGGTLLLAATEQVVNTADITLGGGTIAVGANITETMNNLTLTADSVIDFGGGDGILVFSGFVFSDGVEDYTLTVRNWTGNIGVVGGGGSDQLVFGTTLSSAQLAQIHFEGYDPSMQLDSLEVVPIPEPTAVAAGLGLLGLLGWRERRRLGSLIAARILK